MLVTFFYWVVTFARQFTILPILLSQDQNKNPSQFHWKKLQEILKMSSVSYVSKGRGSEQMLPLHENLIQKFTVGKNPPTYLAFSPESCNALSSSIKPCLHPSVLQGAAKGINTNLNYFFFAKLPQQNYKLNQISAL